MAADEPEKQPAYVAVIGWTVTVAIVVLVVLGVIELVRVVL